MHTYFVAVSNPGVGAEFSCDCFVKHLGLPGELCWNVRIGGGDRLVLGIDSIRIHIYGKMKYTPRSWLATAWTTNIAWNRHALKKETETLYGETKDILHCFRDSSHSLNYQHRNCGQHNLCLLLLCKRVIRVWSNFASKSICLWFWWNTACTMWLIISDTCLGCL